jgi:magnesium chelatase subunit D
LRALVTAAYPAPQLIVPFDTEIPVTVPASVLRYKRLSRKEGSLFILVVDASGSMALKRIQRAREVAFGLLRQSYVRRDSVAIVVFRGVTAEVALPPSRSVLRAKRALDHLIVGGGTPLSAGIACAINLARVAGPKHGAGTMLLFTDGHANVPLQVAPQRFASESANRKLRRQLIDEELSKLGGELKRMKLKVVVIETQKDFASSAARETAATLGARLVQV